MKQILIRHDESIDADTALSCVLKAWRHDHYRTGIVTFTDDIVLVYSDRTKYPTMTLFREKRDRGLKATVTIIEEKK